MEKRNRRVQYLVALSVSMATLTMGISSGWASPVLPKFDNNETSIYVDKHDITWMLSLGPPGFVVGSLVTGMLTDWIGRRGTFLLSAVPYTLGMVMLVSAVRAWMLFLTLFLWNIGSGMLSSIMMLYFSEISDKEIRGSLSLVTKIAFNFGNLLIMCVGPYVDFETLNLILLVLPVTYLIVCWWIPESPYFLLKDGRVQAARKVLKKLRGCNDDVVEEELQQMKGHVKNEMRHSTSLKELFTGRQYRKAIGIAAGLKLTAMLTGGLTISQYLGLIMNESAIDMDKKTTLVVFGAIRFVISIMPSVLVDKVGRRPLLIYSYIGVSISLAIVGIYFFLLEVLLIDKQTMSPYGFITFTGIILSNIVSTIGYNSLVGLIPGEIFPLNIKAAALASLGVFAGILGFTLAKSFQWLKDLIGLCGVFWIFATFALSGAVFSMLYVPETKGKSLKQIQIELQGDYYDNSESMKLNGVEKLGNGVQDDSTETEELNRKENIKV